MVTTEATNNIDHTRQILIKFTQHSQITKVKDTIAWKIFVYFIVHVRNIREKIFVVFLILFYVFLVVFATRCHQVNFIIRINAWLSQAWPGGFCLTEPPGDHELYFWWINKESGNISRSWISVTRICHHYQQMLYRRNCTGTSSVLKKIHETLADPGSVLQEYGTTIDNCYPEEIVRYQSPGYILIETT